MKFLALFLLLALFISCGKKKTDEPVQEEPAPVATVQEQPTAPGPVVEEVPAPQTHEVKKGECLWYIAGYEDIYGDPYQWPKIYEANKSVIGDNPDLIFPDQVFNIPK